MVISKKTVCNNINNNILIYFCVVCMCYHCFFLSFFMYIINLIPHKREEMHVKDVKCNTSIKMVQKIKDKY